MGGRPALTTGLLLAAAAAAGAWKVHAFATANRALDQRGRRCAALLAEASRPAREARARAPRLGSAAPAFTVLGLDGAPLSFRGPGERGAVRLLFVDPASFAPGVWRRLLASYEGSALHGAGARVLVLAAGGPERTRAALRGEGVSWAVGVHAAEVYAAYGFLEAPGVVAVEDGVVRARRPLPITGDDFPLP